MTTLQNLLIGLTTDNPQALVDNLANTNLTTEIICEDRQTNFISSLDQSTKDSLYNNDVLNESALITLLQTKQFIAPLPEPSYAPYESEQAKINSEARAYLGSTDWYITRLTETGVLVPTEITTLRATTRNSIVV